MKSLGKIALAGLIVLGNYAIASAQDEYNPESESKRGYTLEQHCEMSKEGIFHILKAFDRGDIERFSTPSVKFSGHSEKRWNKELECAKKYVEDESGGRYSVSMEKKGGFIRFIIYKRENMS